MKNAYFYSMAIAMLCAGFSVGAMEEPYPGEMNLEENQDIIQIYNNSDHNIRLKIKKREDNNDITYRRMLLAKPYSDVVTVNSRDVEFIKYVVGNSPIQNSIKLPLDAGNHIVFENSLGKWFAEPVITNQESRILYYPYFKLLPLLFLAAEEENKELFEDISPYRKDTKIAKNGLYKINDRAGNIFKKIDPTIFFPNVQKNVEDKGRKKITPVQYASYFDRALLGLPEKEEKNKPLDDVDQAYLDLKRKWDRNKFFYDAGKEYADQINRMIDESYKKLGGTKEFYNNTLKTREEIAFEQRAKAEEEAKQKAAAEEKARAEEKAEREEQLETIRKFLQEAEPPYKNTEDAMLALTKANLPALKVFKGDLLEFMNFVADNYKMRPDKKQ